MEISNDWKRINPELIEGYQELRLREKKAVTAALEELAKAEELGQPPRRMRVMVTNLKTFDFGRYADVLETVGVDIYDSLMIVSPTEYIFQPTPIVKPLEGNTKSTHQG